MENYHYLFLSDFRSSGLSDFPTSGYLYPMTIQEATYYLLNKLREVYPEGEAGSMTDWVMEHLTGSRKAERMIYKNAAITIAEEQKLNEITARLVRQEPLQYVLGESWFCGFRLYVDPQVLIPRPETEELVEWIISNCRFPVDHLRILDIGTGSGCIAVSLKRRIRKAEVWACDISAGALSVAQKNAGMMGTEIRFLETDFLETSNWSQFPKFDILVSNPPYIPVSDQSSMAPNVLEHEPATALFVPDDDPLLFYKAIARFGKEHLEHKGSIYTEIHESLGNESSAVFREAGYTTELKKDLQGKDRMLKMES